jgi:hypothetical protein
MGGCDGPGSRDVDGVVRPAAEPALAPALGRRLDSGAGTYQDELMPPATPESVPDPRRDNDSAG